MNKYLLGLVLADCVLAGRLSGLAAPTSTPETSWQLAGLVIYRMADSAADASRIEAAASYSVRNQARFTVYPDIYAGRWRLSPTVNVLYWPTHYYAPGSPAESRDFDGVYVNTSLEVDALAEYLVTPQFWVGSGWYLKSNDFEWTERPVAGLPSDSLGHLLSAPRLHLRYSALEHPIDPRYGWSLSSAYRWYSGLFGSRYEAFASQYQARAYVPLWQDAVLALGSSWSSVAGEVPFYLMYAPNGYQEGRGIDKGVVNGRQAWQVQAEMRFPVYWRFRGAVFADASRAGDAPKDIAGAWLPSFGGGLRFVLDPLQRTSARADLSYVPGAGLAPVLYVREAF